ncbi:hypothetical protein LJC57_09635, partial [Parabacteroides sp. OttesenSCG-928-G07]|nr:hypothetical protein [Parabacteroides sp. OttesenSCG-928-G07]
LWIQSNHSGKNCLTKVQPGYQMVSNMFSSGWQIENDLFDLDDSSFVSTITMSESDDSILMYIDSYVLSNNDKPIHDKYGNTIECHSEDNPCIIEFF